ncbi:MAG: hypothetical protein IBJ17_00410 [Reyranella sp.]|jgi:hypothetical protein|nr:hypothetical protein [Reyranella sp.]
MANDDDKPEHGSRANGSARPKRRGNDRPFDMWLQKQLHAMYDEIASEPLPDDLLNLIDSDAAQQGAKPSSSQGDKPDPLRRK